MYIVNQYGIIHSVGEGEPIPAGSRPATDAEIAHCEAPNSDCIAANAPKPKPKAKDDAKQPAN